MCAKLTQNTNTAARDAEGDQQHRFRAAGVKDGWGPRSWSMAGGCTVRIVMRQLLQFLHVLRRGADKLSLHPFLGRAETEAAAT